jgi:hypothetical protein
MARRIGLLSVSMAALSLAVTVYVIQGAGATPGEPVAIAEFDAPNAAVAQAWEAPKFEMEAQDAEATSNALFHPAANMAKPACAEGRGVSTLPVNDEMAILCKDGELLGILVTAPGQEPKIVKAMRDDTSCPSETSGEEPTPDA